MAGHDRAAPREQLVLFACCFLILALAAMAWLAFLDRGITFDEAGLYNPAYMWLHYGRITYPIHGHFDDMVVHPPTHYLVLAFLMKAGLSLFHAAAIPPIVFFLAAGFMLLLSPFDFPAKVGLLFGTYLGALVWTSTQTVRPDVSLALAWIAGLIALEAGRLANWDSNRLFAGSLLLTYAATLHYPGSFCWIGVLVYLAWVARSQPWREARGPVAAMCAGMFLIGIPYLVLFVIPFRQEIREVLQQAQGEGGPAAAMRLHLEAYKIYGSLRGVFGSFQPFVQLLQAPLWWLRIPAAFLGAPILFMFPRSRGLALAALPQLLFILFGARHKDIRFSGYFAPEMIVYFSAVISLVTAAIVFLARRVPRRSMSLALMFVGMAALTGITLHDKPSIVENRVRFSPDLKNMDLGRAAARDIAGRNPFIGSTSLGVWYTGGAEHFYNVSPEILYLRTPAIDPAKYFPRFDALVIDQLESWVTWNKERLGLASYYLSGDLQLKGFWLDDRRGGPESEISWMMFGSTRSPVRGYAARAGHMFRFDAASDGDQVLFCAVCPATELRNGGQFDYYLTLYSPSATNDDPRLRPDALAIRTLLVTQQQLVRDVLPQAAHCKIRDRIAGRLMEVDPGAMLAELRRTDPTIHFYRSFAAALGGTGRVSSSNTEVIPGIVDISGIRTVNPQSHVIRRGRSVDVTTAPTRWWDAASIPIRGVERSGSSGFLYVKGHVLSGVVGISIRGHEVNSILGGEAIWGAHDGVTEAYVPIESLQDSEQVVVRNQSARGASEILIDDAVFVAAKPVTR